MKQYLNVEDISVLHVEISTLCNAACPMCARNINGAGLKPWMKERQWSLEDIERVIIPGFINLDLILFCGTHGDPLTAKYFLEAVQRAKSLGYNVFINTNGSLRTIEWWKKLCDVLTEKDRIMFGVDGISTNHFYRQNTDINKILERMKLCCESKVKVQWDFLPFKHNEHELELCKKMSVEMGVDYFRTRKTPRFDKALKYPVADENGTVVRYLEPPDNPELRHPDLKKLIEIYSVGGSPNEKPIGSNIGIPKNRLLKKERFKQNITEYDIQCVYKKEKRIYVNSDLVVFPCCYVSDENETNELNFLENEIKVPIEELNLRNKTWQEILSHDFYNNQFVDSFTDKNKTLVRCIKTCGVVSRESNQNQFIKLKK